MNTKTYLMRINLSHSIKKCSTIDKENISTTYKNTSKIVEISSDSDSNDYNR